MSRRIPFVVLCLAFLGVIGFAAVKLPGYISAGDASRTIGASGTIVILLACLAGCVYLYIDDSPKAWEKRRKQQMAKAFAEIGEFAEKLDQRRNPKELEEFRKQHC